MKSGAVNNAIHAISYGNTSCLSAWLILFFSGRSRPTTNSFSRIVASNCSLLNEFRFIILVCPEVLNIRPRLPFWRSASAFRFDRYRWSIRIQGHYWSLPAHVGEIMIVAHENLRKMKTAQMMRALQILNQIAARAVLEYGTRDNSCTYAGDQRLSRYKSKAALWRTEKIDIFSYFHSSLYRYSGASHERSGIFPA